MQLFVFSELASLGLCILDHAGEGGRAEVLWGPDSLSCLLLDSPLAFIDFNTYAHTEINVAKEKKILENKEVVTESGKIKALFENLLMSQTFRAELRLGMVRRVFFFKSKLSLLLFYLAQGKCLGSSIFSSYGKYYFPFFFFFFSF